MSDHLHTASQNALRGGILLSILGSIHLEDVLRTIILGIIGTVVSFMMTTLLRKLSKKEKK